MMFTGIVRYVGTVRSLRRSAGGARLSIEAGDLADAVSEGASVSVNGVCLTVAFVRSPQIEFDAMAETLRRSTLGMLKVADRVNLERSLQAGETIDGHFVQGHVDGTAKLVRRDTSQGEHILWFEPESGIRHYLIPKGSVAIDGVSLTIAEVMDTAFSVALIPTTLERTTLGERRIGDQVNIETDILARTVVHYLESMGPRGGLNLETLQAHGFA